MSDKLRHIKLRRLVDSPLEEKKNTMDDTDLAIISNLVSLREDDDKKEEKSKKKKKKKDKKKKKKKDKKEKVKKSKMHLDVLDIYSEKDNVSEEEKRDKLYQARFSSSLILLKDILKETNATIVENKQFLNDLKRGYIGEQRVKISPMAISTQMNAISQLINTKLAAIKQITDVNKSISDLELKKISSDLKAKADSGEAQEQNSKLIIDKMFDQLINFDMPEDPNIEKKESKKKKKKKEYDDIDDRIDDLIKSGDMEITDTDEAMKYETKGASVAIRMNNENENEWEFFAIDDEGEEIYDYPLPKKSVVGKVKFNDDFTKGKDELGQVYDVYLI